MTDDSQVRSKLFQIAGYSTVLIGVLVALAFLIPWLIALMQPAPAPIVVQPARVAVAPPAPAPKVGQLERIRTALAAEIKAGAISVEPFGAWVAIRVGNLITFNSGQATALPDFIPVGRRIAEIVQREAGPVRVVGHTDDQALGGGGPFRDNNALSVARANAVAAILRPALTDAARITVEGRGSSEPIADNATPDGRARNRRVEILVTRAD